MRSALVLALVLGSTLIVSPGRVAAETYDYPHANAVDCGQYMWCVDENGDGDHTDTNEWLSSRGYAYRNCTDGAMFWAEQLVGVSVQGLGHGITWDTRAATKNYAVKDGDSNNIEPGDIAQSDDNTYGHVGIVISVTKNAAGQVTSFVTREMNRDEQGNAGQYTNNQKNANQHFKISATMDWDHFIDLNGPDKGINNQAIASGGGAPVQPEPDGGYLPKGAILEMRRVPQGVYIRGWAVDTETTGPIAVHLYGGTGEATPSNILSAVTADQPIPENIHPYGLGNNHGFSVTVPYPYGDHHVCAYGINYGPGQNRRFDCKDIKVSANAFGVLDQVRRVPGGIEALGWTIDADTANPTEVHVYGGSGEPIPANVLRNGWANLERQDVGAAYPGYGAARGFKIFVPTGTETGRVCAFAINVAGTPGSGAPLGCHDIVITPHPFGNFEFAQRVAGGIYISGWAIDPDTASAIHIHAYAGNGQALPTNPMVATLANGERQDLAAAFPGYGPYHAFGATIPTGPEQQTVCVYAINDVSGYSPQLGCKVL